MSTSVVSQRVAVVTGANKGIGYEIVKKMCNQFAGIVYLTARDEQRGKDAIMKLQEEGVVKVKLPKFHQLDITDEASIKRLRDYIADTYNGLDVLINNAGMAYKQKSTAPFPEQAENTIKVNFTGTLNLCRALLPLLKPHGRVVTVGSKAGLLSHIPSQSLRDQFAREDLEESKLAELVQQFVQATKKGDHESKGWPNWAYAVSKIGVNCLSSIQARDNKTKDVLINCCCPGYCKTDMAPNGRKTASEGAETPVYLALIPAGQDQPHGQFYSDMKQSSWK